MYNKEKRYEHLQQNPKVSFKNDIKHINASNGLIWEAEAWSNNYKDWLFFKIAAD